MKRDDIANNASQSLSSTNLKQDWKQQQQRSSPLTKQHSSKYRDYSSIDADPTPVKEARRLSSMFQSRSTTIAVTHHPSLVDNCLSNPLPRIPNANNNNAEEAFLNKSTPLSYSKALMRGLPNKASVTLSATKLLFPPAENHHTTQQQQKQRSIVATPTTSQTTVLSSQLFSISTGIDTPHIQHLISNSRKRGSKITNDANYNKWDVRKQLEQKEADSATLRTALQDLLAGKEQFVDGAVWPLK